ncbi:zf-HC2 domain-containing protein [Nitriliruptor alkaliphilus]|uniref:zf-HC2 domain-containing protein n=1 Tax=Nitriliruptor alkaliphilus TaxID=427918 RepID=UPI000695CD72|nr:zf-HC2 domain-containing protein [Nitriliruptor alkaliphilus]
MADPTPACAPVREAVSAALDSEDTLLPAAEVQRHLDGCAACRRFAAAVPQVNREVRVGGAAQVPDLTAPILVALAEDRAATVDVRTSQLRVLVALAGVVQLTLAVPVLLGLTGPALHVGRDLGAFEFALGAGLLFAAWQPARAAGVLPIAVIVAVTTTLAGIVDLVAGRATILSELNHLTELIGVAALWALTRRLPGTTVRPPAIAGLGGPVRRA